MNDDFFMREALKEGESAFQRGDWPIGCVIVVDDSIIARAGNTVYSTDDKLAHAEMRALRQCKDALRENQGCATLYTTYEPCPMCFGAAVLARIKRIVCGINPDGSGALYFKEHLPLLFKQDKFSLDVRTGVLAEECHTLFMKGEPTKKLIDSGSLNCTTGLKPNIIDAETFERELALCKKLSKENSGGCCWGRCADCGVLPLLVKLYKGEVIDNKEKIAILKQELTQP